MLDWRKAETHIDLPLTVPVDCTISCYGSTPAGEKINTQYGEVTAFQWLMKEAQRMERNGCRVVVIQDGKRVGLFRALNDHEVFPVTEFNRCDWESYNQGRAKILQEAGVLE